MFPVIVDLFDALNHFKTTSPWIRIANIWLTNHSPSKVLNIFDSRTFFTYFKASFWFCHQIVPLGKSVFKQESQLSSRRLMKPIWPRFPIHRHKKHKGTKNSFHYIFKEYHGSDPQLCHGSLGSQMIQWNKNVFKPIFDIKGCTFCAYSSNPGNGYSNRGVNKRGGGRGETQKNGSKY